MELRGFDSYNITLGDEMRGERASMGKSLSQAEADLRVKGNIIVAIEDCDLNGFPEPEFHRRICALIRAISRHGPRGLLPALLL